MKVCNFLAAVKKIVNMFKIAVRCIRYMQLCTLSVNLIRECNSDLIRFRIETCKDG